MTEPTTELLADGGTAEAAAAESLNSAESNLSGPREFAAKVSDLLAPGWPSAPAEEAGTEEAPAGEEQALGEESPTEEAPPQGIEEEQEVQGWPDSAKQRVDKLTARNGKLREQLEAAQGELEAARNEVATRGDILKAPPMPQTVPYAELKTDAELVEKGNQAQRLLAEVQMLKRGLRTDLKQVEAYYRKNEVILKDEDGNEDFSRQRVQDHLDSLEEHARGEVDAVGKRRAWNEEAAKADAACMAYIPWMRDPKSPEYKLAQEAVKFRPEVLNYPDWKLIVAAHVVGMQRINEMVALARHKGQPKTPPKAGTRPANAPGAPAGGGGTELRKTLLNGNSKQVQGAVSSLLTLPAATPAGGRLPGPRKV